MSKNSNHWSRRKFLGSSALGLAGLTVLPGFTLDKSVVGDNDTPTQPRLKKVLKDSSYAYKEMAADLSECAETRWLNKKVEDFVTIHSSGHREQVRVTGQATLEVAKEMKYEGRACLCLTADTRIENIQPRPGCGLEIALDKTDLSAYNRISAWIYLELTGFQNFYFHFSLI